MTETELRTVLIHALEDARVIGIGDETAKAAFVSGEVDIALADLEIDSLAVMQFCIAVEKRSGISVVPRDLRKLPTLGALARKLSSGRFKKVWWRR